MKKNPSRFIENKHLKQRKLSHQPLKWELPEKQQIQPEIKNIFHQLMTKRRKNFLKDRLCEYYGKNFSIDYHPSFNFEQKWQNKNNWEKDINFQANSNQTSLQIMASVIVILLNAITIWLSNLDLFMGPNQLTQIYFWIYGMALGIQATQIIQYVYNKYSNKIQQQFCFYFFQQTLKKWICILYFSLKLAGLQQRKIGLWLIIEILAQYCLYIRTYNRYHSLRLMKFSLIYQYQFKVMDLIITLVVIAHLVALTLFSCTNAGYQITWISNLNIDESNEFVVYLYCFYFGCTTILTVGYGDISPKNMVEVITVCIVEIFGIVMFAYIINEIGYSLSSMRRGRQIIEKDLSVMQKLKKHYEMNEDLSSRVRSYIITHQERNLQFSPQQQNTLLMKLNEQLRNQVQRQNLLAVVKSSIFFLCRWSKLFQSSISVKLQHVLFSPNDVIYEPVGKERIYIIKLGKIDVYAGVNGYKKMEKVLKTIENSLNRPLMHNIYGYTAAISSRRPKFYAISKEFTSAYYIEKLVFAQSVKVQFSDFEYFHEIKGKIDQSSCCEREQVPLFQSSRHHYCPTKANLIRKLISTLQTKNKRKNYIRSKRLYFRNIKNIYDIQLLSKIKKRYGNSLQSSNCMSYGQQQNQVLKSTTRNLHMTSQNEQLQDFVSYFQMKKNLHHFFQSSKEYSNYFQKSNRSEILKKYQNQYFLPCGGLEELADFSLKMYRAITNNYDPQRDP